MTGGETPGDDTLPLQVRFKPALLRKARQYNLHPDRLDCGDDPAAPDWSLDLASVQYAAFVTHRMEGNHLWRYDLIDGDGQRKSIALTFPVSAGMQDAEAQAFLQLARGLSHRLAAITPNLNVALAEYGSSRFWFFLIGVLSGLGGIFLLLIGLADNLSADRLGALIFGSALLILLGAGLVYGYRPWLPPPAVPVGTLAEAFENMGREERA